MPSPANAGRSRSPAHRRRCRGNRATRPSGGSARGTAAAPAARRASAPAPPGWGSCRTGARWCRRGRGCRTACGYARAARPPLLSPVPLPESAATRTRHTRSRTAAAYFLHLAAELLGGDDAALDERLAERHHPALVVAQRVVLLRR